MKVELNLDEASIKTAQRNLERLLDINMGEVHLVRQLLRTVLLSVTDATEEDLFLVSGDEKAYQTAQMEFQDEVGRQVKRYVAEVLTKFQASLASTEHMKVTQRQEVLHQKSMLDQNTIEVDISDLPIGVLNVKLGDVVPVENESRPHYPIDKPLPIVEKEFTLDAGFVTEDGDGKIPDMDFDDFDF